MIGLGTIVNMLAIIAGGGLGLLIKGGLKQKIQDTLMQACGLATIFIGIEGTLSGMFTVTNGTIETSGTLLLIGSLVIGGLIGEVIDLEEKIDHLGEKLKVLVKVQSDTKFVDGFVTATLVVCVGAMAVVGSIQDGLTGDPSMLYTKALLDGIIVLIFASVFGIGAIFSAIPLGIYQGLITLGAVLIAPYLTGALISELSYIGSALIFGIGINICFGKKIKVGNLLPALLVPVAYEIIKNFIR